MPESDGPLLGMWEFWTDGKTYLQKEYGRRGGSNSSGENEANSDDLGAKSGEEGFLLQRGQKGEGE